MAGVNEVIQEIESELMVNVIRKIKDGNDLLEQAGVDSGVITEWHLQRLAEMSSLNEKNIATIAKFTGKQNSEIENLFKKAGLEQIGKTERIYADAVTKGFLKGAEFTAESSPAMQRLIMQYTTVAKSDFNMLNKSMVQSAGNMYRDIVNKVQTKVSFGITTPQKAVEQLVRSWGQQGLTGFIDKGGRQWGADTYAELIVRSNTKEMATQMQFERNREYGNDYIEVSSKADARPKCAEDQGKIYSLSGDTTPIIDGNGDHIDVYDFAQTSHGEADGLFGVNCGHWQAPFIPGLSTKSAPDYPKDKVSKNYKEKQQQRYIERKIRASKREFELQKAVGSEEGIKKADRKVKQWQATQREFIDRTGRTRRYGREQLIGGRGYQDTTKTLKAPRVKPKPAIKGASATARYIEEGRTMKGSGIGVNMKGILPQYTKPFIEAGDDLMNAFPELGLFLDDVKSVTYRGRSKTSTMGQNAYAYGTDMKKRTVKYKNQITLSKTFFGADDLAKSVNGEFGIAHTMVHEMAHQLDHTFSYIMTGIDENILWFKDNRGRSLTAGVINELKRNFPSRFEAYKFSESVLDKVADTLGYNGRNSLVRGRYGEISRYSGTSSVEFFAEVFTKWYYAKDLDNELIGAFDKALYEIVNEVRK
jgi:flagellar biosynthesis/type III secretory pathway protein FliH